MLGGRGRFGLAMTFNIKDQIRKKSREEWAELPKEKFTELRIWIQEHPEQAFVAGIAVGIVLILAFAVVAVVIALTAMCFGLIWYIAEPRSGGANSAPPNGAAS